MSICQLGSQSQHRVSPARTVISSHFAVHDRSLTVRAARGRPTRLRQGGPYRGGARNDRSNSTHIVRNAGWVSLARTVSLRREGREPC